MVLKRPAVHYTVAEYDEMIAKGILGENDRLELIRGEIVPKMAIGDPHASSVKRLNAVLGNRVPGRAIVSIQDPIQLIDSKPEPDVALLIPRRDYYGTSAPVSTEVLLLVEVADSSLDFDRNVKGPLYAENGIVEYWIVKLIDDCLEVHRQPRPDGTFADVRTLRRGDMVDVTALPGVSITVADIL